MLTKKLITQTNELFGYLQKKKFFWLSKSCIFAQFMTDSTINEPITKFEIKLPIFEGPFDLLLFFIERDELDIYDIPIATITLNFLDYLNQMKKMNVEVASEFILLAATLMRVKAKMLIMYLIQFRFL